jgi:hypothetical protein
MAECITQLWLDFHPTVPLTVTFDASHISLSSLRRQGGVRLSLTSDAVHTPRRPSFSVP